MQLALGLLRTAGLRITQPRRLLLRQLTEARQPLSAEDLHRAGGGSQDLVTIYRNLEAFDRAGILHRSHTEQGKSLFQLNEQNQHYHLVICRSCQRAERISACGLGPLEAMAVDLGFREITHHLELFGICADCGDPAAPRNQGSSSAPAGAVESGCRHGH
ncbi:MAG: transcriptional repressor [Opitutales bacterium]|nr:transcriptional repressor [Opitutales bacterium]